MAIVLDGNLGITTPAETVQGALTTTGNTILGDATTDTLNVGAGGLVKDASGNVGIGTASPTSKLHVSTGVAGNLAYFTDAINTDFYIKTASSIATIGPNAGSTNLAFQTSGTERMRIDSSGNVGIGTASPASKLHVRSDADALTVIGQIQNRNAGASAGGLIAFINSNTDLSDNRYSYIGAVTTGAAASGNNLVFATNANGSSAVERMRIDSSGNLLVGTTSAGGKLTVSNATADSYNTQLIHTASGTGASGPYGLFINFTGGTPNNTGNDFFSCRDVTAYRMVVRSNGNVLNTNNSYGSLSDIKLKENIIDATPKLDKLLQVKVRNYNLKTDPDHKQIGVIAQELEFVFPTMIEETEDKETITKTREVEVPAVEEVLDDEGNVITAAVEATTKIEEYTEDVLTGETTKSVKYSVFVPILIKAIQELKAIVDTQAARIAALEA
jgi:hypothetical protein